MNKLKFKLFLFVYFCAEVISIPSVSLIRPSLNEIEISIQQRLNKHLPDLEAKNRIVQEIFSRGRRYATTHSDDVTNNAEKTPDEPEPKIEESADRPKRTIELDPALFSKSEGPDEIIDGFDIEKYLQSQPELHKVFSPSNPTRLTLTDKPAPCDSQTHEPKVKQPILVIPRPVVVEHYEQPILVIHRSLPVVNDIYDTPVVTEAEIESIIVEEVPNHESAPIVKRSAQFYTPMQTYNCNCGCKCSDPELYQSQLNPVFSSSFSPLEEFHGTPFKRDSYTEELATETANSDYDLSETIHEDPNPSTGQKATDFFHDTRECSAHAHTNNVLSNIRHYPFFYPQLMTATLPSSSSKFQYFETGKPGSDYAIPVTTPLTSFSSPTSFSNNLYTTPTYSSWSAVQPQFYKQSSPCVTTSAQSSALKLNVNPKFEVEERQNEETHLEEEMKTTSLQDDEPLIIDLQRYSKDSEENDNEPQKRSSRLKDKLKTPSSSVQEIPEPTINPVSIDHIPVSEAVFETIVPETIPESTTPQIVTEIATGSIPVTAIHPPVESVSAAEPQTDNGCMTEVGLKTVGETVPENFQNAAALIPNNSPQFDTLSVPATTSHTFSDLSAENAFRTAGLNSVGTGMESIIQTAPEKLTKIIFQPYAQTIFKPIVHNGESASRIQMKKPGKLAAVEAQDPSFVQVHSNEQVVPESHLKETLPDLALGQHSALFESVKTEPAEAKEVINIRDEVLPGQNDEANDENSNIVSDDKTLEMSNTGIPKSSIFEAQPVGKVEKSDVTDYQALKPESKIETEQLVEPKLSVKSALKPSERSHRLKDGRKGTTKSGSSAESGNSQNEPSVDGPKRTERKEASKLVESKNISSDSSTERRAKRQSRHPRKINLERKVKSV